MAEYELEEICELEKVTPDLTEVKPEYDLISEKRLSANRRNAQLSTGPKTKPGKQHSRRNALRHGILASKLLVTDGAAAEDNVIFDTFFLALQQDLQPEGELENLMVQEIAICYWRLRRALQAEAASVERVSDPASKPTIYRVVRACSSPTPQPVKNPPSLPPEEDMNRILRYKTSIQRQLAFALNQLERLQRARKGEHVPAPINVDVAGVQ